MTELKFSGRQLDFLKKAAESYIWWMTFEEAMSNPFFIISQVMNYGDVHDSGNLVMLFDRSLLRETLLSAKAGWFTSVVSWGAWNNWLFPENNFVTPPLPKRIIPDGPYGF